MQIIYFNIGSFLKEINSRQIIYYRNEKKLQEKNKIKELKLKKL